jgi:hypothetical protein
VVPRVSRSVRTCSTLRFLALARSSSGMFMVASAFGGMTVCY